MEIKKYIKPCITISLKFLGTFFTFLVSILISKNLSSSAIGIYSLAYSVLTLLLILSKFGLDISLIKFISIYFSENKGGNIKQTILKSIKSSIAISLSLIIIIELVSPVISIHIFNKPELTNFLRIFTIALLPITICHLLSSFFKGTNKIELGVYFESVIVPQFFSFILVFLFYVFNSKSLNNISFGYLLAAIVSSLIVIALYIKNCKKLNNTVSCNYNFQEVLDTSRPLLLVNATNYLMSSTDTVMLGIWCTSSDVGVYNVAIKITLLFSMIISAINALFGPKFAVLYNNNKIEKLKKLVKKISRYMLVFSIILCLVILIFSDRILLLWGSEFLIAKPVLIISLVGQFFVLSKGPLATLLMMCGCEKQHRNNTIFFSILNTILNIILINMSGIYGAALSTTICLVLKNMISIYTAKKELGISIY